MKRKEVQLKKTNKEFTQKLLPEQKEEVEMKSQTPSSSPQPRPVHAHPHAHNPIHRTAHAAEPSGGTMSIERTAILPSEGYRWDVCIVVPNPEFIPPEEDEAAAEIRKGDQEEQARFYEELMERLVLAHLQTYCYLSGDGDEIYIKIRASLERLQEHAELREMVLLLDADYVRKHIDNKRQPIMDNADETSMPPYQFIYAKYKADKHAMYAKADGLAHPFSATVRIKLVMDIIDSEDPTCCKLKLRKLANDGGEGHQSHVLAYFPLHDYEKREELTRVWLNWRVKPWEQPIDDVKDYLGEKVAMYFEFTAHYTTWLLPLSIGGICVSINMAIETGLTGSLNNALLSGYTIPFYCIFVSFWSQLMIEYWKRKEARKAMEWGMSNFEDVEAERPEFEGADAFSFIDGKPIKYFSPAEKVKKYTHSAMVIGGMILLVLCCVSGIFYLQYYVNDQALADDDANKSSGNTGVSILSAVQILVLNSIYSGMAITLTDEENHRTDTEYDDSLIGKLFAFSFINSYASLFFIAFIKSNLGEPCTGPCMSELAYQLTVIFGSKLTLDKVSNYMTLVVNQKLRAREEEKSINDAIAAGRTVLKASKAELEKRLEEYKPSLGVLEDYAQIFIQFGFVTLFVSACPLAPILAYLSNYIEIRADGYKLMKFMRRVVPSGAQDIGTWLVILQMTAIISVMTNAGIVCFTMDLLNFSSTGTVWTFIGFQYSILFSMAIFAGIVDDVPREVTVQLQRQDYLAERALMDDSEREAEDNKASNSRLQHQHFDAANFKVSALSASFHPLCVGPLT